MFIKPSEESATVVRLLAAQVRRDISFGVLPPDSKLKIEDLRQRYGGSAHSFREALTQLANEGLVEAHPQRGFRVASATEADLEDITRLRIEIECLGLRWAFERGGVRWEGAVIAAHHALSRLEELVVSDPAAHALEWEEANREFHTRLIEPCGSPRLIELQQKLLQQSSRFRLASLLENSFDFAASRRAHSELVQAILERRTEDAVALLADHIRGSRTSHFKGGNR